MCKKKIGRILVMDEGRLVGLLTRCDVVRALAAVGGASKAAAVGGGVRGGGESYDPVV
jgi:CBS domain-containing protein